MANTPVDPWQARQDMGTLAEAKRIEADSARHKAAKAEANARIKELSKVVSKPAPKPAAKPTAPRGRK